MKANLERTVVRDIAYLINTACLQADADAPVEVIAKQLCSSSVYKIYLKNSVGTLTGVLQAKQIAMKILEFSCEKCDEQEMLPAIAYVLNSYAAQDLAESPIPVTVDTTLKTVLELMQSNSIREIPVVDADGALIGTLEAKHILQQYLQAKAEAVL